MPLVDLSDEERAAVTAAVRRAISEDPPFPRIALINC